MSDVETASLRLRDDAGVVPTLRILLVEDNEDDADLIALELRRNKLRAEYRRVDTRETTHAALTEGPWDLVLSDHAMPNFSAMGVIEMLQELRLDIPCIIVSGAIGEEAAVTLLKSGAVDYVNKDKLYRLGPAVDRALREAEESRARRAAERALRELNEALEQLVEERTEELRRSETLFRLATRAARVGIWRAERSGAMEWSREALGILGLPVGTPVSYEALLERIHRDDEPRAREAYARSLGPAGDDPIDIEHRVVLPSGAVRWVHVKGEHSTDEARAPTLGTIVDITERKRAEEALRAHADRLAVTNDQLRREIARRERLQADLDRLRGRLIENREQERMSLARELHDDAIQDLLGLSFKLAQDARRAEDGELPVDEVAARLEEHREAMVEIVRNLRHIIRGLRPAGLEFGLRAALEDLIERLHHQHPSAPEIVLEAGEVADLPQPVALCLFRTIQESLRNAVKHARAGRIAIRVEEGAHRVAVVVRDDGCGFEVPEHLSRFVQANHFGLAGIMEHVAALGGELEVVSRPDEGTAVTARVPLAVPGSAPSSVVP